MKHGTKNAVADRFDTEHLRSNLRQRSIRGGALTLLSQGVKFLLTLAATMSLARLLTPSDFGLIAMVAPIAGFVGLFKDLGLSTATIQADKVDHKQVSTFFWINVSLSAALGAFIILIAPVVASFYQDDRVEWIAIAFGFVMFIGGFSAQHQALLERQMRFGVLAAIEMAAALGGMVAGIVAAQHGLSYWALVVMQFATVLINVLMVWLLTGWRPGLPARGSAIRGMLRFGANVMGANALNYIARNVDNVLIGKVWGDLALGIYSKAYGLLMLPLTQINGPVSRVAIPMLSRLHEEPQRYRRAYLDVTDKVLLATVPGIAAMIATAEWIIDVVLGAQWVGAAEIFFWLGIAALVQPLGHTAGWLFISQGRASELFRWTMLGSILVAVAVVGGLPWGPSGVAASYAVSGLLIRTPALLWWVSRRGPVSLPDLVRLLGPFVFSVPLILAALYSIRFWATIDGAAGVMTCLLLAYGIQLLISLSLSRHRLMMGELVKSILSKRRRLGTRDG